MEPIALRAAAPHTTAGHGPQDAWWPRLREASPAMFWSGVVLLLLSLPTAVLTQLDTRLLYGVSVWLKPWKFQVSVGVYLLTLCLFMTALPAAERHGRWARVLAGMAVACGLFEVAYISWQGLLGQASHFNFSSAFHRTMYTLMGVGAVLLTTSSLVLAVLIARSKGYRSTPATRLGVMLGLVLTWVLGLGFGAYMGGQAGGHWVGGPPTDAGGLPVVQWSRSAGDLRVAHFFGIHAMHFVPLFAWLLGLARLPGGLARLLVWVGAAAFTALTVATFVQARAGLPFIA